MVIEATSGDVTKEGTISVTVDGVSTNFVREVDFGAVKGAREKAESQVSTLQANLTEANRLKDEAHQNTLKERAAKETAEAKGIEGATHQTRVGELETEVKTLKESLTTYNTSKETALRKSLSEKRKVPEDKIKDKTLAELESIEASFSLTDGEPTLDKEGKPLPPNLDDKSIVPGILNTDPEAAKTKISAGFEKLHPAGV